MKYRSDEFQFFKNLQNLIQFIDAISSSMLILTLLLLITSTVQQTNLPLSAPIKVELNSSTYHLYYVQIPNNIEAYQDMFITTIPIVDIPSQLPLITLKAKNYSTKCYQANNQLEGVCTISHADLIARGNQVVTLSLSCIQTCTFMLQAYLNDVLTIKPAKIYKMHPQINSNAIFEFQMQVPDEVFDQIAIQAEITQDDSVDKGVEMYANVGNYGAIQPNQEHYQYKAIPIFKGIGINIPKNQLPKGTWIKITVFTNTNIETILNAHLSYGSNYQLPLNKHIYCFLAPQIQKIYTLDVTSMISDIQNNDISIIALIYSGLPELKVSFDPNFQSFIQNYGIGGSLDYLLTPAIRQANKFIGKIYIKAISSTQAYFDLSASIYPKEYVYMKDAVTYISLIESLGIENYIYDFYYELKSNESAQKILHFTVKLNALIGSGYYMSRICNEQSLSACILTQASQLSDKKFLQQTDQLPGDVLIYGNLYEIYLTAKVKQCRITQQQGNSTFYICRIHNVGYNFNPKGNLEWGLTTYSRQKNIELLQGKPFKDMVYEGSYNYYVVTVPSGITELSTFITVLSGQAKLVTSQLYTNPQFLFAYLQGNDIRVSPNNFISYSNAALGQKVFIGVYGSSMSEYVINVAVKRNSTKSTKIALIPKVQQLFHTDGNSLTFKLTFNTSGEWIAQVITLIGDISTTLNDAQTSKLICSDFYRCFLNAGPKDEMIITVKSEKYAKFTINYYPKQSCRVLPIGSVNFIQIQPNTTQCVEFFVTNKNLQISYSQNLLHSFISNVSISLQINQHNIISMDSHYLTLTKQQLKNHCKFANASSNLTKNCILSLKITGDNNAKTELQLSVIDLSTPIPLLDGINLPFSQKNFKKQTGVYFYYYSISTNPPVLFIRSLAYQSFFVSYAWVEYEAYTNSSSTSIFPSYPGLADYKHSFELNSYRRMLQLKIPLPYGSCEDCLLLISLHAQENYKESIFQLEISSQEGRLQLGETISGKLNKDQFYTYQLQTIDNNQAVISLQNYKGGQGCYQAVLTQQKSSEQITFQGNQIIIANKNQHKLSIRSFENNCKYEIYYWHVDVPIRIIIQGLRYSLSVQNSSSTYFLYYHQANSSFHLFQSVRKGYIKSHATPIKDSLQNTINQGKYLFGTDSIYENIQISPNNSNFCYNCYYLIKATGAPSAMGSIGVADSQTIVQLTDDEVIREKVEGGVRYYDYYTFAAFKIKMSIVYGTVDMEVTDLKKTQLFSETLSSDREFSFNASNSTDYMVGFQIKLTIKKSATFSLQAIEDSNTKLIEGYPMSINFRSSQGEKFSYSHASNELFNILLIFDQNMAERIGITIQVVAITSSGTKNLSLSSNQLGNIYSYDIPGEIADYSITITTNTTIRIKLLVSRNKLTYLQPLIKTLSKDNTIYEIYTGGSPIMLELFSCKGDMQLSASAKYSQVQQIQSSDSIALQHSNIGGHYVIESRSLQHQYFALARSRSSLSPLYIISYTSIKSLPYGYFDTIQRTIAYKLGKDYFEITFEVPGVLNKRIKDAIGQFVLMVSDKSSDFNALIQCGMGTPLLTFREDLPPFTQETKQYTFNITRKQLEKLITGDIQTYFMGIVMNITFKQDGVYRKLKYIYETLEFSLAFPNLTESSDSSIASFVFFWIVLPLLAGVAIAWYSLRYCIHRLRMFANPNNQLMEEEVSREPTIGEKSQIEQIVN